MYRRNIQHENYIMANIAHEGSLYVLMQYKGYSREQLTKWSGKLEKPTCVGHLVAFFRNSSIACVYNVTCASEPRTDEEIARVCVISVLHGCIWGRYVPQWLATRDKCIISYMSGDCLNICSSFLRAEDATRVRRLSQLNLEAIGQLKSYEERVIAIAFWTIREISRTIMDIDTTIAKLDAKLHLLLSVDDRWVYLAIGGALCGYQKIESDTL